MGLGDIFKISQFKSRIAQLEASEQKLQDDNAEMSEKIEGLGARDYYQVKQMTEALQSEHDASKKALQEKYTVLENTLEENYKKRSADFKQQENLFEQKYKYLDEREHTLSDSVYSKVDELSKTSKKIDSQVRKLQRARELYKAMEHALNEFMDYEPSQSRIKLSTSNLSDLEELSPSIILKLHCMDVRDLRKAYKENDKQITSTLEKYSARYTTKANQAIYKLMVIALRAELQNILYNLKYEKLDQSIENVKSVTQKYLKIAGEGNQTIMGTLSKFIGEIEYLFISAVKIEYNYYIKKEQAKQEQLEIRAQMRQDAEERKALELEKKRVEQEESKYNQEIEALNAQLGDAFGEELEHLKSRILELQSQLSNVIIKKEEIVKLVNGQAGNVYVISNLGSFGESVFKIGMTRRLDPMDRVRELGNASVPFKFDVHSFIFSDNAVDLEKKLHSTLNEKRVNKVNLRKEFFHTTIDELENIVAEVEPTAEFNRTMLAEEFLQSQSTDTIYTNDTVFDDLDDEE
ncbi:GIY-YIG nuclease family protein [Lachnospiraceae bacterium ZAX-1]